MQSAVITGGQGDLGKSLAAALAAAGMDVHAPGRQELDVTCPESVRKFFTGQERTDLLVCNAGLTSDMPLTRMRETNWARVIDVNLKGAFLCAREAAPSMMKRRSGHMVFISSFSAIHPPAGQANYAAAKSGLLGMAKSMARELGPRNIRVNVVMPGFMETKMTSGLPAAAKQASLDRHTLRRFNTPDSVASFVTFLHQHMPHTSGQTFNLDSRITR